MGPRGEAARIHARRSNGRSKITGNGNGNGNGGGSGSGNGNGNGGAAAIAEDRVGNGCCAAAMMPRRFADEAPLAARNVESDPTKCVTRFTKQTPYVF